MQPPDFKVGLIDGPVDLGHPAFAGARLVPVSAGRDGGCADARSAACQHGTAMAGILFAGAGTEAPGLCQGCMGLLYPLFGEDLDGTQEDADADALAQAIVHTVDAGARLINLSLGVLSPVIARYARLEEACDHARRRGTLLVCAAGNQARLGHHALVSHPWVIPVVACDARGHALPLSNLGPSIGRQGLSERADAVLAARAGGGYAEVSGTSVAAARLSGRLAALWAEHPRLSAAEMRQIALASAYRPFRTLVPPPFDVRAARALCQQHVRQKEAIMEVETALETAAARPGVAPATTPGLVPRRTAPVPHRPQARPTAELGLQSGASCPSCAAAAGGDASPPTYIYAVGTLKMRFPSPGVEKEFAQVMAGTGTAGVSDAQALYQVLLENRYLANEVCWVFSVENTDAYLLVPRDTHTLDRFIAATAPASRGVDVDVIVGQRGPMAPPEMCNGLVVPIVLADQIYSFNKPDLVNAIVKPKDSGMTDKAFRSAADDLFERIQQLADNIGATDEHRALNYLSVRYQQIYTHTAAMYARDYSLTAVEVIPSRLAATRRLVDVVLTYNHRGTDVTEKYYVRVDVTEKFPFLDKKLSPYYDR